MEFCPNCGTLLVPTKINRAIFLTCPRCAYKSKTKKISEYKISEKGKEPHEVAVIVDKKGKQKKPNQKEFEIEPPEYDEDQYE